MLKSSPELKIEVIADEAGLVNLAGEWSRLHEQVSPRMPFMTPLWVTTWWKHYKRDNGKAQDSICAFALRDNAGDLVAVAPMVLTSRPGYGRLRVKELQFIGADTNVTELRGPLCQPERTE